MPPLEYVNWAEMMRRTGQAVAPGTIGPAMMYPMRGDQVVTLMSPTLESVAPGPFAAFDAPTTPGPWALNKSGRWFKVVNQAPGSKVVGNIYVPPGHPSVRKTIPELNKQIPGEKRFLDAKFRSANRAALQANWRNLFFKIAPRGSGPEGIGAGRAFDGTPEDYDTEGGDLYPDLKPGDAKAAELVRWWGATNGFDPKYGSGRLDLSWLRVYTDSAGYQRYKQFTKSEATSYFNRWMLAKNDFVCGGDDVINLANTTMAEQARRAAAQTAGDYSPHYVWHIGPISQCMPRSSRRRRKAIKKAAAVAAVVVGAVYLGPMVSGALKGTGTAAVTGTGSAGAASILQPVVVTATKLTTAAAATAAATTVVAPATLAAVGASIAAGAAALIPKVVEVANAASTIKAIKDGEVPPPPITLEGDNFADYASSIGKQILTRQLEEKRVTLTEAQNAAELRELDAEIRRLQYRAQAQLPYGTPQYPVQQLAPAARAEMADERADTDWIKMAALAVPLLFVMRG